LNIWWAPSVLNTERCTGRAQGGHQRTAVANTAGGAAANPGHRRHALVPPDNGETLPVHSLFAATGRFAVRFRWAIVVAWVAAAILANLFFPSLTSVAKQLAGRARSSPRNRWTRSVSRNRRAGR
jgi:hypothetical protein